MAQNTWTIPSVSTTKATALGNWNDQIENLVTLHSGTSAPSTTFPFMWWADTTNNIFGTSAALHPGYPATVDGQAAFVRAVAAAVRGVPGGRGRGVFYWAPEWIAVPGAPSAWENATLFDFDGLALASLDALPQAGGTVTPAPTPAPSAAATQP